MALLRREHLEVGVIAATVSSLSVSLVHAGWGWSAAGLAALGLLALAQDHLSLKSPDWHSYASRVAGSEGLAVGALALPWTFAGLLACGMRHNAAPGFAGTALHLSLASSAAMLAMLGCQAALPSMRIAAPAAPQEVQYTHANAHGNGHGNGVTLADAVKASMGSQGKAAGSSRSGNASKKGLVRRPASQSSLTSIVTTAEAAQDSAESSQQPPNGPCTKPGLLDGSSGLVGAARGATEGSESGVWLRLLGVACLLLLGVTLGGPVLQGTDASLPTATSPPADGPLSVAINATASAGGMHLILTRLPNCFTIGEAMVVAQALALLTYDVIRQAVRKASHGVPATSGIADGMLNIDGHMASGQFSSQQTVSNVGDMGRFVEMLVAAVLLASLLCAPLLRSACQASQSRQSQLLRLACVGVIAVLGLATVVRPALWAISFALSGWRRALLLGYWVALLLLGLPVMDWASKAGKVPTIIIRKGYHILAMALFLPALMLEPELLALALGIAFALLMVVEVVRIGKVPWLGPRIHAFMTSFIDSRDAGILLVSHFSLLVGMAVPVWLTLSVLSQAGATAQRIPAAAFAGIMSLGLADSAASVIGRIYGRHPICIGNTKTLEGTFSGVGCTLLGWAALVMLGGSAGLHNLLQSRTLGCLVLATTGSCLLEAATTQLDNIFIPLHYFAVLAAFVS